VWTDFIYLFIYLFNAARLLRERIGASTLLEEQVVGSG
jgi:hypothetical protein